MAKINDGSVPGGKKPAPSEFDLEKEILEGVFKNNEDEIRGGTIGIEAIRAINPRFDVERKDTDAFDAAKRIDIGADKKPEQEIDIKNDIKKQRRESDTGLTVQMNQILMKRNLKNSGKI